jgi:hypothetical protein
MRKRLDFGQCYAAARRKAALVLALVMCTLLGLGLSAGAQQGTFITFGAPGAGRFGLSESVMPSRTVMKETPQIDSSYFCGGPESRIRRVRGCPTGVGGQAEVFIGWSTARISTMREVRMVL